MPKLKCEVKNCSFNDSYYCTLSQIKVGETSATNSVETCCESFSESEYIASNCATCPEEVVHVKCDAVECIHNYSHECMASGIEISGAHTACAVEDTQCNTFVCGENRA